METCKEQIHILKLKLTLRTTTELSIIQQKLFLWAQARKQLQPSADIRNYYF